MQDEASRRAPSLWVCFARGPPLSPNAVQELKQKETPLLRLTRKRHSAQGQIRLDGLCGFVVTSSAFNSFFIYYMAAYLLFL